MPMPGITPTSITLERKIWTPTDGGRTRRTTDKSGCRMSRRIGLRIAMATGSGSLTTDGLGLAMSLGAGLHITMGVGCGTAIRGRGGLDRCGAADFTVRSGLRRMFRFSGSEVGGDLVLDGADGGALDGCPSDLVTASSRGGAGMAAGSAW